MRVTRNYRNSMVNPRKNSKNEQASLIQNALKRNSTSSRASRLASILGNKNTSTTSALAGRDFITSTAKSQKFYYDMQYHANQVEEYADALKSSNKNSVYDKARESGSTEQIVSDIKGFVAQYNNMLSDLEESGTRADSSILSQINSMARLAEKDLAATGISRKSDGTLVIDEEKLAAADVDTLEKVWGGSGFASKASTKAGTVAATAEKNIEAEKSSVYSPFDRANLYSSSNSAGKYFNYRR
ncbi:MAG: hypothetical protein HDR07_09570 [Lachnospiraceae bacterium]|nr:hypothetical protein [Lachnospiraceae bacterium]